MTQIERIRDIINDKFVQGELFDISDIAGFSRIPRTSIRRVLSRITSEGGIERIEKGLFRKRLDEDELDARRKFVSGLFYCGGKKRQFFALTIEQNTTDRESELIEAMESAFGNCSDMRANHGYSDDIFTGSQIPDSQIYPNIEVGEL